MEGLETVSSAADLSASFPTGDAPADTGAETIDATEPLSPDNEGGETDLDALNATGETEDANPDDINHEETEDIAPPVETKDAATEDELPEGVRKGQDRSGKQGLFVTPERWKTIYDGGYKQMKALETIAGGAFTPQQFQVYNDAFDAQEKLFGNLLSGDPAAVGDVFSYFLKEGAAAMEQGLVGTDPIVPMAQQFYSTIQNHPEAYAALRMKAGTDLVTEMYAEAAQTGNRNLWLATGHIAKTLGLPFKKSDEMESFAKVQTDPVRTLTQENQQLRAKLEGRSVNGQAAQLDTWRTTTKQATLSAVLNEAVMPALSEVQAAWGKLPGGKEAFKDLVQDRLHSQVLKTMNEDSRFEGRMKLLRENAARATSAQRRAEIGKDIERAHVNRANLAIEALLPSVKKFANTAYQERNAATHQRRANGATHRAPGGSGTPVKQSLVPAGMDFDNATPAKLAASLKGLFQ